MVRQHSIFIAVLSFTGSLVCWALFLGIPIRGQIPFEPPLHSCCAQSESVGARTKASGAKEETRCAPPCRLTCVIISEQSRGYWETSLGLKPALPHPSCLDSSTLLPNDIRFLTTNVGQQVHCTPIRRKSDRLALWCLGPLPTCCRVQ